MSANDTVQLSVVGNVSTQQHVHTLHFRQRPISGLGINNEQQLIDAWQAACNVTYLAMFRSFNNPIERLIARQVCGSVPLRAPIEETVTAGTQPGTKATTGDDMPPWLATVYSVRTALQGKSRRGRFFIGGVSEDEQERGNLNAGAITRYQGYATALLAAFGPAGTNADFRLVVHSRKLALPGVQCQDSSTETNGIILRLVLGSMKSRKAGSGL